MMQEQRPVSLPAPGSPSVHEDEDRNQPPDTTTDGPQNLPLSPVEMRQLTQTLGRLYNSCESSVIF